MQDAKVGRWCLLYNSEEGFEVKSHKIGDIWHQDASRFRSFL